MIPALLKLMDQMKDVLGRLEKLEKDSHPPQPVITGEEFDQYKIATDNRISELEDKVTALGVRLNKNGVM